MNPKSIAICCIALLCCAACVPTPDHAFVVSKADDALEQAIAATPVPVTVPISHSEPSAAVASVLPQPKTERPAELTAVPTAEPNNRFPDRWEETLPVSEYVTVYFDADVVQKADGIYPVYRTAPMTFTERDVSRICAAILPQPKESIGTEPTKADYEEQFRAFLSEVDAQRSCSGGEDGDDALLTDAEIDEQSRAFMDAIAAASEETVSAPFAGFENVGFGGTRLALLDGRTVDVDAYETDICISYGANHVYRRAEYERDLRYPEGAEPQAKMWRDAAVSEPDARRTVENTLQALGMEDYTIVAFEEANLYSSHGEGQRPAFVASGWYYRLSRDYGGYPVNLLGKADQRLTYEDADEREVGKPIREETLYIMADGSGVVLYVHRNPKRVVRVENENVSLLPFDELQAYAKNGLLFGLAPYRTIQYERSFTVFRALLTTYTLRIRNESDYREMPCWVLMYEIGKPGSAFESDLTESHRALVVNAIDGSIVNPRKGY